VIGVGLALPWHLAMHELYGQEFWSRLAFPVGRLAAARSSVGVYAMAIRLIPLYPAILAIGIYGWFRAVRRALQAEESAETPLWPSSWVAFWLALGLLLPSVWPGQGSCLVLLLAAPLCLLSADGLVALNARRISLRALLVLMVLTLSCILWWQTRAFQVACHQVVASVQQWHQPPLAQAIRFHLFVDVVAGLALLAWMLYRWALARDGRQLAILGVFLAMVVGVTGAKGLWEISQVARRARDWKLLRRELAARYANVKGLRITTFGSMHPTGQMLFAVRAALGWRDVQHCRTLNELKQTLSGPGSHAVVVTGRVPRLPHEVLMPMGQRRDVLARLYGGAAAALYGSQPGAEEGRDKK